MGKDIYYMCGWRLIQVRNLLLECPRCRREWSITGDGKVLCSSCGYETDSYNGAMQYIENTDRLKTPECSDVKTKLPIYECPKCGSLALVDQGEAGRSAVCQFLCFSCGSQWSENELQRCPECFQWKHSGEFEELIICRSSVGFYVCRACYENIFK
jgi:Zn-finger nucleic acid-binding protein